MTEKTDQQTTDIQFQVQKLYTKDISLEIPQGASIFNKEWKPDLNVALNTEVNDLPEENIYEVILTVTVNVKSGEDEAFKGEVQQAGVFTIANMKDEQLHHAQYAFCPNLLYHYAREAISDLVLKGGFPQLCLATVNFDLMYQQKQQQNTETSTDSL